MASIVNDARVPQQVHVAAVSAQSLSSPAFRIRVLLLREELARLGVAVEPHALFSPADAEAFYGAPLVRRAPVAVRARRRLAQELAGLDAGTVLLQRQADLLPSLRLERLLAHGRRLVWDVDDAIWRSSDRRPLAALKGMFRKVPWLARRADHVLAANRVLAEHLSRYTDRITVVPSTVETRGMPVRRHEQDDELVLGWIGSFSTAPYLERLREPLAAVARKRPVRLVVVGGTTGPVPGVEVELVPWSVEAERAVLARMDVGVVPQPDTEWARGKSAYKALQYMAAGVPVVADDVGVVAENVGDGGIVVRGPRDWIEALERLGGDASLRSRVGAAGRERAEREFSVERWAPVVAAILSGESP